MAENRTTRLAEIYKSEKSKGGGVGSTLGKAALEKMDPRQLFNQKGFLAAALPSLFKAYKATPDVKSKNPSLSPSTFNSAVFDEMSTNMRIVAKESLNLSRIAFDMNLMKQNTATLVRNQNKITTGKAAKKGDIFFKKVGGRDAEYKSKFKKESKTTAQTPTGSASGTGQTGGSSSLKDIGMNALDSAMSGLGKGAGLAAIGFGIGGFITGLALGGAAVNELGGASGVKDILVNLAEGLNAFTVSSLLALGSMLGAGMLFGAVGGPAAAAYGGIGIAAVGAGLGGFLAALALSGTAVKMLGGSDGLRDLLINLATGLNPLSELDGTNLLKVGGSLLALTAGLAALFGLKIASGIKEFFFGEDDPKKGPLAKLAEQLKLFKDIDGENLSKLGQGFKDLTSGLYNLATMSDKDMAQAQKNTTAAVGMAKRSASTSSPSAGSNPSSGSPGGGGNIPFTPSKDTGSPGSSGDAEVDKILATIRQRESGGNYTAQTPKGSASGAYQFINSTWKGLTKQYGIGTEYGSAKDAPPEIQDAVASAYVKDILKKNNGDVSKVPLVWYTGNAQGQMSAAALATNGGLTPEAYQAKWLASYNSQGGSQVASAPSSPSSGQKVASSSAAVADGQRAAASSSGGNVTNTVNNVGGSGATQTVVASSANPYDDSIARMIMGGMSA
jgi:hypothetical protein